MLSPEVKELLSRAHAGKLQRFISEQELLFKEGQVKEYFEGKVEKVWEYEKRIMVRIGKLLIYISNFELPIFEGDVIRFRNFYCKGGTIWVDSETMIVKRRRAPIKLAEGIMYLVKGKVQNGRFSINGKEYEIKGMDLERFEGKTLVLQQVMFKNNSFEILPNTKVFLVKK